MNKIKLQAHRGVSSECPENTFSAFRAAVMQGYDVIELDPGYTKDKKIVILHDNFINRTAVKGGMPPSEEISINDITYAEALEYDFGAAVSKKFSGEKIPLLSDALKFAVENEIRIKIDGRIAAFPEEILGTFFKEIKRYSQYVSVTAGDIEFAKRALREVPGAAIDYDGVVDEEALRLLGSLVPRERLTVWLPYECENTSWVTVPFADESLAALVKKYANLGIWLITDYRCFCDAAKRLKPDIVETDGTIKPKKNEGCRYDMHTHSKYSHDSKCEIAAMADMAKKRRLYGFAVTDHCDIGYYDGLDIAEAARASLEAAAVTDTKTDVSVLKGIEIGEAIRHQKAAESIIKKFNFDVVIGSVHAVRFAGCEMPYSQIDFSKIGKKTTIDYLEGYFDDMLEMLECCDFDVLAHLTCPLRYINGRYKIGIDCRLYEDKIKRILKGIIKRKIALEINTSCVYEGSNYSEFMPEEWIIQMYKDMGGYLVTTGSDAHIAENSANNFDALYALLKKIGFKNTYYYKNRCPIQCTIK